MPAGRADFSKPAGFVRAAGLGHSVAFGSGDGPHHLHDPAKNAAVFCGRTHGADGSVYYGKHGWRFSIAPAVRERSSGRSGTCSPEG
jgi:hypothetical protein